MDIIEKSKGIKRGFVKKIITQVDQKGKFSAKDIFEMDVVDLLEWQIKKESEFIQASNKELVNRAERLKFEVKHKLYKPKKDDIISGIIYLDFFAKILLSKKR